MRRICPLASAFSQVGIRPIVWPLSGSVSISGTGMNGAVAGFNQELQSAARALPLAAPHSPRLQISARQAILMQCAMRGRHGRDPHAGVIRGEAMSLDALAWAGIARAALSVASYSRGAPRALDGRRQARR